jgi:hypothetical protein
MRDYFVVTNGKGIFVALSLHGSPFCTMELYSDFPNEESVKIAADTINKNEYYRNKHGEFRVMKLAFVEINHD